MSYTKVVPVVSNQVTFPEIVQMRIIQNGRSENDMDVTVILTSEIDAFFLYKVKISSKDFVFMKEKQEFTFEFRELFCKLTSLIDEVADTNSSLFLNVRAHGLRDYFLEVKEQQPTRYITHFVLNLFEGSAEEIQEHARRTILDLRNSIKDLQSLVDQSQKAENELKGEVKKRDSLMEDMQENFKKTLQEFGDKVMEKSEARKWYEEQLSKIESSRDAELKNLYQALKTIQDEKINCEAALSNLRSENKKVFDELEAIKSIGRESEARFVVLAQENASNCRELDDALKNLRSAKAVLLQKQEEVTKLQSEVQQLKQMLNISNCRKHELHSLLEAKSRELIQLQDEFRCFQDKYAVLGQDLRKSHSIISNLNCVMEEKEVTLKKMTEKIKAITTSHEAQQKEMVQLNSTLADKEQRIAQLLDEVKKNEALISQLKKDKESSVNSLKYLTTEFNALKIDLKKSKEPSTPVRAIDSYYNLKFSEQNQRIPTTNDSLSLSSKVLPPEPISETVLPKKQTPPSTIPFKNSTRENEIVTSKTALGHVKVSKQNNREVSSSRTSGKKTPVYSKNSKV